MSRRGHVLDRTPKKGYFALGHRGARRHAPSNSLKAFDIALELGCDGVELDLRRTRDGHVIARHDKTVVTGSARRKLSSLDRAELGEVAPTLGEVVEWVSSRPEVLADIEVKEPGYAAQLARQLLPIRRQVLVTSFVPDVLWSLSHAKPKLNTAFLAMHGGPFNVEIAKMVGAVGIVWRDRYVDKAVVSMTTDADLVAMVWDVRSNKRIRELVGWGVRVIITDLVRRP